MTRVLVADDDADVREMTAQLFALRGWSVKTVTSGHEALAALEGEDYDVAVLDQTMPPGSGLEVAAHRRMVGDSIPIVLWTGWAGNLDAEDAQRLEVHLINKADVTQLAELVGQLARRG